MYIKKLKDELRKDSYVRRIIKNSGVILAGTSTASALNLVSFAVMASELGPALLGILVLCQTYCLILNDLFNVQTWESMIKYGAAKIKDDAIKDIIFTNFIIDLISAIIAFLAAIFLATSVANLLGWEESVVPLIALYSISILFNITTFTVGIPRLFDKFLTVSIVYSVMAVVKLILILAASYILDGGLLMYVSIFLGVEVITGLTLIVFSFIIIKKKYGGGWWRRKPKIDRGLIKFLWWTNLRTIVRIPVRHLDMLIISSVMSMSTLGIYKVYKEIAGMIGRIGEPVNQAIFPEFAKLIGSSNIKRSLEVTKKTMSILAVVGVFLCSGLFLASEFIVGRFFGEEYLVEIGAIYWMLLLNCVAFITVPINSLFIAAGFAKYSFMVLLFTNSIYLATAIGLGYVYGIYGVIIAYGIQVVLNKGLKVYLMKKHDLGWDTMIR